MCYSSLYGVRRTSPYTGSLRKTPMRRYESAHKPKQQSALPTVSLLQHGPASMRCSGRAPHNASVMLTESIPSNGQRLAAERDVDRWTESTV